MTPYYDDGQVVIYHGDCREVTNWTEADVLVTDPPYGIGWTVPAYNGGREHRGIVGDNDTSARDHAIRRMADKPCLVFGSSIAPAPVATRQTLVWAKPTDAGIFGCIAGWRRDWEPIYLLGNWPRGTAERSGVIRTQGSLTQYATGDHPHAKPVDLLRRLILTCPPGVIADPFMGSGTTLRACKDLGRRAVGVEIDEHYCEIAARRVCQEVLDFGDTA